MLVERVGLLGGTFDPPHNGHLTMALEAFHLLELSRLVVAVAGDPWQKSGERHITNAALRLRMVEAAFDGFDGIEVSDAEIQRGGATYTVDTLRELANPQRALFLILGEDAACGLDTWHHPAQVAQLAHVAVLSRPGGDCSVPDMFETTFLPTPELEISSSNIRERVAQGAPIGGLVPSAVREILAEVGLYRGQN